MKSLFKILLLIFLTSFITKVLAFELSVDHPHYVPEFTGGLVTFGGGAGHREVEYESNGTLVDQQFYKFNDTRAKVLVSPWQNFAFGMIGQYDIDREYEVKFGPASSRFGDPNYNSSASGPLDPEVFFIYEFRSRKDSWNQQVYLSGNPFDIKEEPRKIFRGGHDVFLEYRFGHKYETGALYGQLFSHYFGKKNFFQPGDSRYSVSEAYTEVGLKVGYLLKVHEKWSFFGEGSFGLSSDYIVRTPEVQRYADKGYLYFFGIGVNHFLSEKCFVTVKTWRGSRVYNANQEDLSRDINFEIEDDFYLITLSYAWGRLL